MTRRVPVGVLRAKIDARIKTLREQRDADLLQLAVIDRTIAELEELQAQIESLAEEPETP